MRRGTAVADDLRRTEGRVAAVGAVADQRPATATSQRHGPRGQPSSRDQGRLRRQGATERTGIPGDRAALKGQQLKPTTGNVPVVDTRESDKDGTGSAVRWTESPCNRYSQFRPY